MKRSIALLTIVAAALFVVLVMSTPAALAQPQTLLTPPCAASSSQRAGAVASASFPQINPCASTLFWPLQDQAGLAKNFLQGRLRSFQSILPALSNGARVYREVRSQPGGLRRGDSFRERTALRWLAAPAMAWMCGLEGPVADIEKAFHVTMGVYQQPRKIARSMLRTVSPRWTCRSTLAHLRVWTTIRSRIRSRIATDCGREVQCHIGSGPASLVLR